MSGSYDDLSPQTNSGSPIAIVRAQFSKRLLNLLAERNWSQSELARRAEANLPEGGKIGRDNVSNYVRERALPGRTFLLAMAKALGTTPETLLPERGERDSSRGALPSIDIREASNGMAWVRINKALPWSVALKIVAAIKEIESDDF
jgi:transcriptional regulator with XRE-family HTH domain